MLAIDAFRRRYLNVRFRTRGSSRARIVEFPGRWMAGDELDALLDDMRTVVRAGVPGGSLDYGVLSDPERLRHAVLTIIYSEPDGRPVAFNALHVLPCETGGRTEDVIHLGLVLIDPEFRQHGLTGALLGITCFLLITRRQMRPMWVSNVTQVPLVAGLVGDFIDDVYPSAHPGARRTFAHLQIARQVATRHREVFGAGPETEFDAERFILRNAYTGGSANLKKTFAEAPKSRDEAVNAMCRDQLDYARGDDFLQVGRFTFSVARRYLTRSSSVISPVFLLMQGGMLFLESVFAPVLQWFTPERSMGMLRPVSEREWPA